MAGRIAGSRTQSTAGPTPYLSTTTSSTSPLLTACMTTASAKPAAGNTNFSARRVVDVARPSPAPNAAVNTAWCRIAGPKKSRRYRKVSKPASMPWVRALSTRK